MYAKLALLLLHAQIQKGLEGQRINPSVSEESVELAKAVNYVTECIWPVIHNASNTENINKMRGGAFEFSHDLLMATDKITSLVANLRKLAKSDMTLSDLSRVCIIPAANSCLQSNWADVSVTSIIAKSIASYQAEVRPKHIFFLS